MLRGSENSYRERVREWHTERGSENGTLRGGQRTAYSEGVKNGIVERGSENGTLRGGGGQKTEH